MKAVRGRARQEDVAKALKVTQPTVSGWEKGTQAPPLEKIPELERFVGVQLGTVFRLAGYVEGDEASVEAAVLRDASLDEIAREGVLRTYRTLRQAP